MLIKQYQEARLTLQELRARTSCNNVEVNVEQTNFNNVEVNVEQTVLVELEERRQRCKQGTRHIHSVIAMRLSQALIATAVDMNISCRAYDSYRLAKVYPPKFKNDFLNSLQTMVA